MIVTSCKRTNKRTTCGNYSIWDVYLMKPVGNVCVSNVAPEPLPFLIVKAPAALQILQLDECVNVQGQQQPQNPCVKLNACTGPAILASYYARLLFC